MCLHVTFPRRIWGTNHGVQHTINLSATRRSPSDISGHRASDWQFLRYWPWPDKSQERIEGCKWSRQRAWGRSRTMFHVIWLHFWICYKMILEHSESYYGLWNITFPQGRPTDSLRTESFSDSQSWYPNLSCCFSRPSCHSYWLRSFILVPCTLLLILHVSRTMWLRN